MRKKGKKKKEFDAVETIGANVNEYETFSGVINFEERNFSKLKIPRKIAVLIIQLFLKMKKRRQIGSHI